MLHGFHVIVSTYGFWLPNDPRGSWSDFVRSWELLRFGKATKITTRHSVAAVAHDVGKRLAAKQSLAYPEVHLSGVQALSVANGFRAAIEEARYIVFACSILPQHVHMVFGPHERDIRRIAGHLKARATQRLSADALHPLARYRQKDGTVPSPWGRKGWVVYLYSERHLIQAIKYVAENPLKESKRRQSWSFVQPYPFTK
jgi:REP element-mobilizing transposase RayT